MLRRAAKELGIDLGKSFAVGDSERDLEAGRRVGSRTVLVRTGYGRETESAWGARAHADYIGDDIADAVTWILRQRRTAAHRT